MKNCENCGVLFNETETAVIVNDEWFYCSVECMEEDLDRQQHNFQ